MLRDKIAIPLLFWVVVVLVTITTAALRGQPPNNQSRTEQQGAYQDDFASQFPVTEYSPAEPADVSQRNKRQSKSKKYDQSLAPLTPHTNEIFSSLDWEVGLPALPVNKSHAVVMGEVTEAKAYLSNDKTGVYSEFTVRIAEVLKNTSNISIATGATLNMERPGGRVRLPSGQLALVFTRAQGMPKVGRQYVFFLTHDFPLNGFQENDLYILTGYELRAGRVFPLDSPHGHPISAYKGRDEISFLGELRMALANLK